MCRYCEMDYDYPIKICKPSDDGWVVSFKVGQLVKCPDLLIEHDEYSYYLINGYRHTRIKYCPMCGKRLEV